MTGKMLIAVMGVSAAFAVATPSTAFASGTLLVTVGSGGYDNYPSYRRHDRQHNRIEERHENGHDRLEDAHDDAHDQGLSRREHRYVHEDLNYQHARQDYQIARQHSRKHRRNHRQRRYSSFGFGGYGY